MQPISMILTRFKENISWTYDLPKDISIIVYNKGPDELKAPDTHPNITIHNKIVNLGRESETILRYIMLNYDNLPDVMVFSQADPATHSPDFIKLLWKIQNNGLSQDIFPMTLRWEPEHPPVVVYSPFKDSYYIETASRFTLGALRFWDDGIKNVYFDYCYVNPEYIVGTDVYNHFCKMIGIDDPDFEKKSTFDFFYSGCFAVKKEAVLQHSKNFYMNCLSIVNRHPVFGFFFERIWWKLFNR